MHNIKIYETPRLEEFEFKGTITKGPEHKFREQSHSMGVRRRDMCVSLAGEAGNKKKIAIRQLADVSGSKLMI